MGLTLTGLPVTELGLDVKIVRSPSLEVRALKLCPLATPPTPPLSGCLLLLLWLMMLVMVVVAADAGLLLLLPPAAGEEAPWVLFALSVRERRDSPVWLGGRLLRWRLGGTEMGFELLAE